MSTVVSPIRDASRRLVREWGLLRPTLAGTSLSPTDAHCLFEIGQGEMRTVSQLRDILAIDEPELALALEDLSLAGEIERAPVQDGTSERDVAFALTAKGRGTLQVLNVAAAKQVQSAVEACAPAAVATIVHGMQLYAAALQALRTPPKTTVALPFPAIDIAQGYRSGILARSLEMHTSFYARHCNWGCTFERRLAEGLADLLGRLDRPANEAWAAVQTTAAAPTITTASDTYPSHPDRIVGTIFIDGEDLGRPGVVAHLRAFIVDDQVRGSGAGRRLLAAAMEFCRQIGFQEVQLWTLRSLVAARRLYETAGFVEVSEEESLEFGVSTKVMHYRWIRPDM